jgi:hypothetical protein
VLIAQHMDTPAPDNNLRRAKAADLAKAPSCTSPWTHPRRGPKSRHHALRFPSTSQQKERLVLTSPYRVALSRAFAPAKKEAVSSPTSRLNLREWLVGPILVSNFLSLMIAGAILQPVVLTSAG